MPFKIPSKRRRSYSSLIPVIGRSDSIRSSSMARSSPVPRTELAGYPQQKPKRKVSLLPSSSGRSSVAPSSRTDSVAPTSHPAYNAPPDAGVLAECDDEILEREDNDSLNEIVMAVDLRDRGTVGCCYYIARQEKLYMIEDVKSGGIEVIDTREILYTEDFYYHLTESSEAAHSAHRHTIINKSGRKCRCSSGPRRKESGISQWRWYVSMIC